MIPQLLVVLPLDKHGADGMCPQSAQSHMLLVISGAVCFQALYGEQMVGTARYDLDFQLSNAPICLYLRL
jgi:hypothetical protein